MAKSARAAENIATLDALGGEIDDVLRGTMYQVEHNELEVAALFPFSVALNQAPAAICERRTQLMARLSPATLASAQVSQLLVVAGEVAADRHLD